MLTAGRSYHALETPPQSPGLESQIDRQHKGAEDLLQLLEYSPLFHKLVDRLKGRVVGRIIFDPDSVCPRIRSCRRGLRHHDKRNTNDENIPTCRRHRAQQGRRRLGHSADCDGWVGGKKASGQTSVRRHHEKLSPLLPLLPRKTTSVPARVGIEHSTQPARGAPETTGAPPHFGAACLLSCDWRPAIHDVKLVTGAEDDRAIGHLSGA